MPAPGQHTARARAAHPTSASARPGRCGRVPRGLIARAARDGRDAWGRYRSAGWGFSLRDSSRSAVAIGKPLRRVVSLLALAACASAAVAATTSAAAPGGVTRIVSPAVNQVAGPGGVQVVLRSRASLHRLQILVDGHHVERYFHGSHGIYRARLRVGSGLHLGIDELLVVTGSNGEMDHVPFVVARSAPSLLRLRALQVGGDGARVRVVARVAPGATLQAWVNGHRADGAFEPKELVMSACSARTTGRDPGRTVSRRSPTGRVRRYADAELFRDDADLCRPRGALTAGAGRVWTNYHRWQVHPTPRGVCSTRGSRRGAACHLPSWRIVSGGAALLLRLTTRAAKRRTCRQCSGVTIGRPPRSSPRTEGVVSSTWR